MFPPMKLWTWKEENLPSVGHAVRTAVAATLSVVLARLLGMPEAYWAVIATLVVMQSPLSSTVPLAIQRIVASALGASLGAIESARFGANLVAFALTMFVLGLVSLVFRLEKVGYSYAGMTLAIICLFRGPRCHGLLRCIVSPKYHWEFWLPWEWWVSGGKSSAFSVILKP